MTSVLISWSLHKICTSNVRFIHICKCCSANVKYVAQLQTDVEEQIKSNEIKVRKHPGKRNIGNVALPDQLIQAVQNVIPDVNSQMVEQAKKLKNVLFSRRPAIEKEEYISRAESLFNRKCKGYPEDLTDAQLEAVSQSVKNKLRQEVGRCKPINYDAHSSKLNLIARLSPNYAAISWVFSEIKQTVPSFAPKTVLDFGSGVGSVVWAAYNTWGPVLKEYFGVDVSPDMNALAERLLKGGDEEGEALIKTIFFRQFLPTSDRVKHDLVVSAFSMMEIPSLDERLRVIDILWKKTTDTLVVIENGSFAGYTMVMDARDYILHMENAKKSENSSYTSGAHVVAPCPHDMPCPKIQDSKIAPCNSEVSYQPLFPAVEGHGVRKETFSFVVLRKKPRRTDSEYWPRIVQRVIKPKRHVRCHLCCSDGELHHVVFTKKRNTREAYRCARVSSLGDLLPVSLSTVTQDPEELDDYDLEDLVEKTQS